jgi:hypothetical protein
MSRRDIIALLGEPLAVHTPKQVLSAKSSIALNPPLASEQWQYVSHTESGPRTTFYLIDFTNGTVKCIQIDCLRP